MKEMLIGINCAFMLAVILLAIYHLITYYRIYGLYRKPTKTNSAGKNVLERYNGYKWNISIQKEDDEIFIKIGCKENTIEFWDNFFSKDVLKHQNREYSTSRNTISFKRIRKDYLYVRKQALTYLNNE